MKHPTRPHKIDLQFDSSCNQSSREHQAAQRATSADMTQQMMSRWCGNWRMETSAVNISDWLSLLEHPTEVHPGRKPPISPLHLSSWDHPLDHYHLQHSGLRPLRRGALFFLLIEKHNTSTLQTHFVLGVWGVSPWILRKHTKLIDDLICIFLRGILALTSRRTSGSKVKPAFGIVSCVDISQWI